MTATGKYEQRALNYDELTPGRGLHFPVTAPHYIRNGPEVSVSFSITFRTPDLESRARTHIFKIPGSSKQTELASGREG